MSWRRWLLNMEWQIDGGSGHVLWSLNKAGHINLQRSAGCRLVEDGPRRPQVRLGWLFLVWADIRADQMHIETAFRSHLQLRWIHQLHSLLFSSSVLSSSQPVGNIPFSSTHNMDPAVLYCPLSYCLPTTFLALTCHDGGVCVNSRRVSDQSGLIYRLCV